MANANDDITPLLGPDDNYGSLSVDSGGGSGWNELRRRAPTTNRPRPSSKSGAASGGSRDNKSRGGKGWDKLRRRVRSGSHRHLKSSQTSRPQGRAVLNNLWALQSLHEDAKEAEERARRDTAHERKHSWVYTLLNPRSRQFHAVFFQHFIATVIIVDLAFYIASTEPQYNINGKKHALFHMAEGITSTIFLIEYIARLVTCVECHKFRHDGPCVGRLKYMLTFPALIDAFATLPFFLELILSVQLPTLTFLRAFRLLRILKTQQISRALSAVTRVISYNSEILWVAFFLCIFLVLVTAFLMYYLRPRNDPVDASDFSSIGATMYLSTLMLTGQGGPEGDLPWYTKGVVLATGVFSIGMFAIPASMLTWGFEAEAERLAAKAIRKARRKKRGEGSTDDSTSSSSSSSSSDDDGESSSSIDTSDEEYQRIIAGDEDEDDEDGEFMRLFTSADADHSGSLTKSEFLRIMHATMSSHEQKMKPTVGESSVGASTLVERVKKLEEKVDATNEKLDRLLGIMQRRFGD